MPATAETLVLTDGSLACSIYKNLETRHSTRGQLGSTRWNSRQVLVSTILSSSKVGCYNPPLPPMSILFTLIITKTVF